MRIFNNTDVPIDLRDRVILPGMSLDLPSVTEHSLSPDERRAIKLGALGTSASEKALSLRAKVKNRKSAIFSLSKVLELL